MLVIAVGVESLNTKEVEAALLERKAGASSDSALGLEVQREAALCHDVVGQIRRGLLAGLVFVVATDPVLESHAPMWSAAKRAMIKECFFGQR